MGAEFNFGTLLMVAFVITSVCYLFITVSTYMYDSQTKTRRDYMYTGITLFIFSFFYGFMTIAEIQSSLHVLWSIGFFAGCMFFPFWLMFLTNLITIKRRLIKDLIRVVFYLSAFISLLCIFLGDVTFVQTEFGSQFTLPNNSLLIFFFVYNLILSGVLLFMHIVWYRQSVLRRSRRQVLIFIIISSIALPTVLVTDYIIPIFADFTFIPLGSIMILPPSFFVFFSLRKFKLLGITVSNVSQYTFTSVKMPIYVLDNNNRIVLENKAAVECLGISAIGKSISAYLIFDGQTPDESFYRNDFASMSVNLKAISGIRICDMSLTIEKDNYNDAICKIVVFTDITEIKEMERSSALSLSEALEANRVKSDFLAKMSHEIRTPMNAIIGMTELVLREKTSQTVREHAVTIKQSSENLLSIINDLLDFSKIETGKIQIAPEHYSLTSLVNDVVNIIKVRMSFSGVRFAVNLSKYIPNVLIGDAARIRQILINVLSNAVKHTDQGEITLTILDEPVNEKTIELIMIIEDTGSGIKKENIERIFTEYYQVRKSSDGVGLGLAITRGLVTAMNGDISVESEYGKGSKFTIKVPQRVGDLSQQALLNDPNNVDDASIQFDKKSVFTAPDARVLVVDDINTNLKVVSGLLAPYRLNVDTCLSGSKAIEAVKTNKYDIVLMDYRMPGMDGVEATSRIRAMNVVDPYYSTLPIIALTADAVSGRREMLISSGFSDFISKPINSDDLNTVLEKWIPKDKKIAPPLITANADNITASDAEQIVIDGIDINKGIRLSGGNKENYFEILASFHDDAMDRLDLIQDYIVSKDLEQYITVIHAIKSATANIGADNVSLLAASLESAGLIRDWYYIGKITTAS